MTPTREQLAAWADGQISGELAEQIADAVERDPKLQREVEIHRALRERLGSHFAPLLDEPVPDRLARLVRNEAEVVDFAAARQLRQEKGHPARWVWFAGPALAASLALAMFVPRGAENAAPGYVDPPIAQALESQLIATQDTGAQTRILLSFRNKSEEFCRAFSADESSGIACRDEQGWRLAIQGEPGPAVDSEYRQAGADLSAILAEAQEMAAGPALDAGQEASARARGWR